MSNPIVLYDGVCALCNRFTQFLLKRDRHARLRFAPLQSEFSVSLLKRHGINPQELDTVYVVVDYGQSSERVLARLEAAIYLLHQLGGVWQLSILGRALPKFLRDAIYAAIARNRYRVFGKYETCLLPEERFRNRFLDAPISVRDSTP